LPSENLCKAHRARVGRTFLSDEKLKGISDLKVPHPCDIFCDRACGQTLL